MDKVPACNGLLTRRRRSMPQKPKILCVIVLDDERYYPDTFMQTPFDAAPSSVNASRAVIHERARRISPSVEFNELLVAAYLGGQQMHVSMRIAVPVTVMLTGILQYRMSDRPYAEAEVDMQQTATTSQGYGEMSLQCVLTSHAEKESP